MTTLDYHALSALLAESDAPHCGSCSADAKLSPVAPGVSQLTVYHDADCPDYLSRTGANRRDRRAAKRRR